MRGRSNFRLLHNPGRLPAKIFMTPTSSAGRHLIVRSTAGVASLPVAAAAHASMGLAPQVFWILPPEAMPIHPSFLVAAKVPVKLSGHVCRNGFGGSNQSGGGMCQTGQPQVRAATASLQSPCNRAERPGACGVRNRLEFQNRDHRNELYRGDLCPWRRVWSDPELRKTV